MAGKSLSELVNAALTEADQGLKLASARDAETADLGDFLATELSYGVKTAAEECSACHHDPCTCKKEKSEEKAEKSEKKAGLSAVLTDADFAMKLAEALELGSNVITAKLAEGQSHVDAPGPEVMESGFEGAQTQSPKAHATVADRITGPTTAGPGGLPTSKADFTSPKDQSGRAQNHPGKTAGWTRSKQAAERLLNAKVAQAETLRRLGQIKAAEQLEAEIHKQSSDAEDGTDGNITAGKGQGRLDTEPGDASHIPDNAGIISMTRAQAKDKTTREVGQYISESPKEDNAVAAHALSTHGLKMSSLVVPRTKRAAESEDDKKKSKAEEKSETKAEEKAEKSAAFDPEAARAYLRKVAVLAQDTEAHPAERAKAASLVQEIKARSGFNPDKLLG